MRRAALAALLRLALVALPARRPTSARCRRPSGRRRRASSRSRKTTGLYHQSWFQLSFLDLREDFAGRQGRRASASP